MDEIAVLWGLFCIGYEVCNGTPCVQRPSRAILVCIFVFFVVQVSAIFGVVGCSAYVFCCFGICYFASAIVLLFGSVAIPVAWLFLLCASFLCHGVEQQIIFLLLLQAFVNLFRNTGTISCVYLHLQQDHIPRPACI